MKNKNGQDKQSSDTLDTLHYLEGQEAIASVMAKELGKKAVKVERPKSKIPSFLQEQAG